jgi:hypothetical protein
MFWRFAFGEGASPKPQVLLVNHAEVVPSVCDGCGDALVFSPKGESILIAGPCAPGSPIHYYCANCGNRLWIPTLSGRALKRYSID